jgi:hypothetical protein
LPHPDRQPRADGDLRGQDVRVAVGSKQETLAASRPASER